MGVVEALKLPPHNIQAEQAVLGSLLIDPRSIDFVLEIISADDFYRHEHRLIFEAITTLGNEADVVTTAERLESIGVIDETGGIAYLGELYETTPRGMNVGAYSRIVKNNSSARRVIAVSNLGAGAEADTWQQVADKIMRELLESGGVSRKWECDMRTALKGAVAIVDAAHNSGGMVGIPTGIHKLDDHLGGLHDTDLIVVGGRPAMGKTAFMLNCVTHGPGVSGIISTEQPADQLALRLLAIDARICAQKLRNAQLDEEEYKRMTVRMSDLASKGWRINDQPSITISRLERQARAWKSGFDIKALYIDYIQNIKHDDRGINKTEAIGDVIKRLKQLARELKIPVFALAQVNRGVEQRPDKRPRMGDLYHSSEIEMEADVVMLLYRDEVYNADTEHAGTAEILIDKNRHGATGKVVTAWNAQYLRFDNFAPMQNEY